MNGDMGTVATFLPVGWLEGLRNLFPHLACGRHSSLVSAHYLTESLIFGSKSQAPGTCSLGQNKDTDVELGGRAARAAGRAGLGK